MFVAGIAILLANPQRAIGQSWNKIQITDRASGFDGARVSPALIVRENGYRVVYAETDRPDSTTPFRSRSVSVRFANVHTNGIIDNEVWNGNGIPQLDAGTLPNRRGVVVALMDVGDSSACLSLLTSLDNGSADVQEIGSCDVHYPSVATDSLGGLHVTYVQRGALWYVASNTTGDWNPPVQLLPDAFDCETPAIAVESDGTVHVAVRSRSSERRTSLFYITGSDGSFGSPELLRSLSRAEVAFEVPYVWPPQPPSIAVSRDGTCHVAITAMFGIDTKSTHVIHMVRHDTGWAASESITEIGHYNKCALAFDKSGRLHAVVEYHDSTDWDLLHNVMSDDQWGRWTDLTDNDIDDYAHSANGTFLRTHNNNLAIPYLTYEQIDEKRPTESDEIEVALLATGLSVQRNDQFTLYFDTVAAEVGQPGTISLKLAPAPVFADSIFSITCIVDYDRDAIHFESVKPGNAALTPSGDGQANLRLSFDQPLEDSIVAQLQFVGLVTGKARNHVSIESSDVVARAAVFNQSPGLILLDGCDIARPVGFGRAARLVQVYPNPTSGMCNVEWQSSVPTRPVLRVVDALGKTVWQMQLEVLAPQEDRAQVEVDLDSVRPGVYRLQLVDQNDVSSTLLIVAE